MVDLIDVVAGRIRWTHAALLQSVADLDDVQLTWSPAATAPPVWFHAWHIARWADRTRAAHLPPPSAATGGHVATEEIWAAQQIAARWSMDAAALGNEETGMGLDDGLAAILPYPGRAALLMYVEPALAAADIAVGTFSDGDAGLPARGEYSRPRAVAEVLLSHLGHASRHLGMVEALVGVQGLRGTATGPIDRSRWT